MEKSTFWLMVMLLALIACSDFENLQQPEQKSCDAPKMTQNQKATPSWTWFGITVGISTEKELLEKMGQPERISAWPATKELPGACLYHYPLSDLDAVVFWLSGNEVIGVEFFDTKIPLQASWPSVTLQQMLDMFGLPDIIGWSLNGAGRRSVVWLSQGVQVDVIDNHGDYNKSTIEKIRYFTPMNETQFTNSFWSRFVLDFDPSLDTDYIDGGPRDPFGITE